MSAFCIILDEKRCIHCKACELHCRIWNNTSEDVRPGVHHSFGPFLQDGRPVLRAAFMGCLHCEDPWCVRACPSGAMRRREDGIVYVDPRHCVGCRACIMACPWRIPQWDPTANTVVKCDFCRERTDAGRLPACVAACTARALSFTDAPEARETVRRLQERAGYVRISLPHGTLCNE